MQAIDELAYVIELMLPETNLFRSALRLLM